MYYNEHGEEVTESEIEDMYDDMLNDVYGPVNICGIDYDAGQALSEVDPTAYRVGMADYESDLIEDGVIFETDPTQLADA